MVYWHKKRNDDKLVHVNQGGSLFYEFGDDNLTIQTNVPDCNEIWRKEE